MNEMSFWLITLLILLSSSALFVLPILRGKDSNEPQDRDELNKAFFYDRIAEIKKEAQDGLVGDENEITVELQKSLIDDIPADKEKKSERPAVTFARLFPGILLIFVISYGLYSKVGNYDEVVDWQNVSSRLPELSKLLNTGELLTEQEMQDLILALRTQMNKTPNEAMGWLLLGRLGLANRDALVTQGAMEKAYRLAPDNPEIKFGYAQAMMLSGDEAQINQARNLLRDIIQQDKANMQAVSLLAFDAFERRDFAVAISLWSQMKTLISDDDPKQEMLTRSIEQAQKLLTPSASTKNVKVRISLDKKVILPPQAMLIVSVHDQHNSPMPVAAKLLPVNAFPVDVEITDADSMLKERLLSSLPKVVVRARIDSDGNVMTKSNDWGAETGAFNLGESENIVINQIIK